MPQLIEYRTLRDFARTYTIHADCPACRHHVRLDLARVADLVGWDALLDEVHRALRCSNCGRRGADVRIGHDGRPSRS